MKSLKSILLAVVFVALPAVSQSLPSAERSQEPRWPQSFEVQGPQVQVYGFAVTQPGPILVSVQGQGAPLSVSVQGPLPNPRPPLVQSGPGSLRVQYDVTAQDLQHGVFWQIQVRLAQPAPAQAGGHASGNITVQHPPVNQALMLQAMQALAAQRHIPTPGERAQAIAQARAARDADFNAHKAQLAQRRAQNHAAIGAQLQPMLDEMRRQKAMLQQPAGAAGPGSEIRSRAVPPQLHLRPLPAPMPNITGYTVAHDQDPINLPAGSPPYGQPGDGVTIAGTGFGNDDGELHFVIGPYQDIIVDNANAVWLDNKIFSPVPWISGVGAYSGGIYLKRRDGAKSNIVPFQFEPDMEQREIRIPTDYILAQFGGVDTYFFASDGPPDFDTGVVYEFAGEITRSNYNWFSGVTGVDRFFISTKLKNGWTVAQQPIAYTPMGGWSQGQAFVLTSFVGTDVLSVDTVFSVNPMFGGGLFDYMILIPIQGPKGTADGIVCVNIQC